MKEEKRILFDKDIRKKFFNKIIPMRTIDVNLDKWWRLIFLN